MLTVHERIMLLQPGRSEPRTLLYKEACRKEVGYKDFAGFRSFKHYSLERTAASEL